MRIARSLLDDVISHARAEAPNECVGMIASRNGEAVAVHRARNAAASPLRYEIESQEQFRLMDAIEDDGLELGAIYHSHTRSDPVPSQTDINLAAIGDGADRQPAYPGTLYIIVGIKDRDRPDVRAWSIVLDEVSEAELEVVP
jgi:[CysO sulfur-carrier protein]-S-L-cysteine hydrolase